MDSTVSEMYLARVSRLAPVVRLLNEYGIDVRVDVHPNLSGNPAKWGIRLVAWRMGSNTVWTKVVGETEPVRDLAESMRAAINASYHR